MIDKATARQDGTPLSRSPGFLLAVLTFTFSVGFIDRQILNLLVQPIKADMQLSDLDISFLQGVGFSIPYLILSPICGRWVDSGKRRNILLGAVSVWSAFTAACGFMGTFGGLLSARAGVGAAESGLTPSAWSMLADSFEGASLTRAFSIYNLGPYIGNGFALIFGGGVMAAAAGWSSTTIGAHFPLKAWQITFIAVSLIGLIAIVLLLLVREPARKETPGHASGPMPLARAIAILRENKRFYGCFFIGMSAINVPVYAFPSWLPAMVMRRFHVPISTVGYQYGLTVLLSGCAGVLLSPTFARLLVKAGYRDGDMRLVLFASASLMAACAGLYMASSYAMALAFGGLASFSFSVPAAVAAASLQRVTPNRMRGMVSAIYIFMTTVMGLGLAPLLVAFLTDKVFRDEMRVGESLAIVSALAAVICFVMVARSLAAFRVLLDRPAGSHQDTPVHDG